MTVRLLHVNAGNLYGGIETMLVTLAGDAGSTPGLEHRFATAFEGRLSDELRTAGVSVTTLGGARLSRPWTVWRGRRRLRERVEGDRLDVVVFHGPWALAVYGPALARTSAQPWLWIHSPLSPEAWLDRLALRVTPHAVVANSRFTLDTSAPLLPAHTSREVVYPPLRPAAPVSTMDRRRIREGLRTHTDDVVIVCACRMERWKGVHLLVEALGRLRDERGWTAWIAGGAQRPSEGRYVAELRGSAERLRIEERIRFLGQRSDVPRLLGAADIHCQPNLAPEPFGIAFVDAMAHGLAIVTTPMGAVTEYLDEAAASLVAPTAEAVGHALLEAIRDPTRRARLGAVARARAAERFAPDVVLPALARLASGGRQ